MQALSTSVLQHAHFSLLQPHYHTLHFHMVVSSPHSCHQAAKDRQFLFVAATNLHYGSTCLFLGLLHAPCRTLVLQAWLPGKFCHYHACCMSRRPLLGGQSLKENVYARTQSCHNTACGHLQSHMSCLEAFAHPMTLSPPFVLLVHHISWPSPTAQECSKPTKLRVRVTARAMPQDPSCAELVAMEATSLWSSSAWGFRPPHGMSMHRLVGFRLNQKSS